MDNMVWVRKQSVAVRLGGLNQITVTQPLCLSTHLASVQEPSLLMPIKGIHFPWRMCMCLEACHYRVSVPSEPWDPFSPGRAGAGEPCCLLDSGHLPRPHPFSYIGVKFTEHTISHFKINNSVAFSTPVMLATTKKNIFITPKENLVHIK